MDYFTGKWIEKALHELEESAKTTRAVVMRRIAELESYMVGKEGRIMDKLDEVIGALKTIKPVIVKIAADEAVLIKKIEDLIVSGNNDPRLQEALDLATGIKADADTVDANVADVADSNP